ncbi:hypothetical protein LTR17_009638 [Elasticomyces elasticus]|nr:hypothetical protein LTR17_009638 [Elasticomyces elasticus]
MTSALISPAAQAPMDPNGMTGPPPRKRRRRTAGGGATDDCFACRKRAVKCDRKRPYCTQCIDIGKECSGYKTTLTWGVGVASRGKLRGLACPVANKNVDGTDVSAEDMGKRRRKSSLSSMKTEDVSEPRAAPIAPMAGIEEHPPQPPTPNVLPLPTLPLPIPQQRTNWQIPGFQEHIQARPDDGMRHGSFTLPPLHRLQTGMNMQYGNNGMPSSAISVGSYAETEYHSPMEYPQTTSGSLPYPDMPNPYADQPMTAGSVDSYTMSSASTDPYAESVGAMQTSDFADHTITPSQSQLDPLDHMLFNGDEMGYNHFEMFATDGQDGAKEGEEDSLALFDTRFSNPFFHLTPRLQSLMEYYDRYICPFLVAFDGSENPYRRHILQLAVHNEGLQNAIAALSTNNLRMRKKQPQQQLGFIEELTDAFDGSGTLTTSDNPNEASAEESMYKQMSIDQLNLQLSDSRSAHDDSVLATLLILCLFHVCDSGFSKFKTQLAGVQKLLSLRGSPGSPSAKSDFTGWVEMFFTWFDVMTSTVNDREMQIKGESLDMLDFSANLGALEQFSGCDGRLFKVIARLGRLNLLAQGREVRRGDGLESTPRMSTVKPKRVSVMSRFPKRKGRMFEKELSAMDYDQIDGNGWGTPIISSDDDAEGSVDEDANSAPKDNRREFWEEWQDVRTRLQSWQMDNTGAPASEDLDAGHRDLVHINETFRFSALIYTERLAHPCLPSSHLQFQTLVSQALFHITALSVTSCVNKFLLWPLFITGTECVDEGHRSIIRTRCMEVQKESGFFNNISGLEVLERVWREVGRNVQGMRDEEDEVMARRRDSLAGAGRGGRGRYGQAFRWRKAMDRVDGEYIVI